MNVLLAYARERLPISRLGPLALVIGLLGGRPARVGLAFSMITTFRIRDDLADREYDAVAHPERIMVRARSSRPFAAAVAIGLALAFVGLIRARGLARGLGLLGLAAAFELGYRLDLPGRHRWVLLKYPIFGILLGDSRVLTKAALYYLALAIHERLDDERLRSRADANLRLAAYLLAFASLAAVQLYGRLRGRRR